MAWRYVLDTSALIDLNDFYSAHRFPRVWESFTGLVAEGRAVAPEQVFDEVIKSKFLHEWCTANKSMFVKLKIPCVRHAGYPTSIKR